MSQLPIFGHVHVLARQQGRVQQVEVILQPTCSLSSSDIKSEMKRCRISDFTSRTFCWSLERTSQRGKGQINPKKSNSSDFPVNSFSPPAASVRL